MMAVKRLTGIKHCSQFLIDPSITVWISTQTLISIPVDWIYIKKFEPVICWSIIDPLVGHGSEGQMINVSPFKNYWFRS